MTILCWCVSGDSITATAETATTSNCWPYQYLGLTPTYPEFPQAYFAPNQAPFVYYKNNIIMKNMAIVGSGLSNAAGGSTGEFTGVLQLAPPYADTIVSTKAVSSFGSGTTAITARKYLWTCSIGSNDGAANCGDLGISGSPSGYAAAIATMMGARKTAGYDIIALSTLLPRADGTMTEPNRLAYNAIVTGAGWAASNNIDYIMDFAGDTIMGNPNNLPANNGGDTTYYRSDNVHPTDVGQARLAAVAATTLNTILASI